MARHDRIAARYAKAIFSLGTGDAEKKALLDELEQVSQLVTSNRDLTKLFGTELFPEPQRRAVVEDLAKSLRLSQLTTRTLLVLSEKKRLGVLAPIVEKLKLLQLEAAEVVPLRVESANELSSDEQTKVEKKFSQILGKKVEADYALEPLVIGGLRVTANGRTYDGSISGWLSAIREQLAEGSI